MKFLVIGIIGLLGGIIVTKSLITAPTDNSADRAMAPTQQPQDIAEMREILDEMKDVRDEIIALLETEKSKYADLSSRVETLATEVDTRIDLVGSEIVANNRRNTRNNEATNYSANTLVDAGLTSVEAERVLELEAEARNQVQELIADPENRSRDAIREIARTYSQQIRSELGDYSYETYLEATGRQTSVSVGSVEPESSGAAAGLIAGDRITSYGGERVFDIADVQAATTSGTVGETVVVEVLRDDQTLTLVMPRGEIGISTRGRRQNN